MQQLVYAIQFKGAASPMEGRPNELQVHTEAASVSSTSVVNDGGLTGGFDPAAVATVQFESMVTVEDGGAFREKGSITFGTTGHRLFFKCCGDGWMGPSPQEGMKQGSVTWTVEGGEGQFAGAEGVITSNFTVDSNGAVVDYHLGVIYIR